MCYEPMGMSGTFFSGFEKCYLNSDFELKTYAKCHEQVLIPLEPREKPSYFP